MPEHTGETIEARLREADPHDRAITDHGFTGSRRDYDVITALPGSTLRYRFHDCVEVRCRSLMPRLRPRTAAPASVEAPTAGAGAPPGAAEWDATRPTGAHWGRVRAWEYRQSSPLADEWEEDLGIPFHELWILTESLELTLVFHELGLSAAEGTSP